MRNASTRLRRAAGLLLSGVAGIALAACSGGGGGGGGTSLPDNPPALKVLNITSHKRDGWERNKSIEFFFSAPLAKKSLKPGIIEKAIQVGVVTANGRIPAKGTFRFKEENNKLVYNKVIFDPTRTASAGDGCADNPFGFEPLTTYDITIPTPATSTKFLTSTGQDAIVESYSSFFTTGEAYVRENLQPRYIGTDGQGAIGFEPPRFLSGEVPYNARVLLVFGEAMDPTTFDNGAAIMVRNDTLSNIQGRDVIVPGNFTNDPCGLVWKFVPSFSFGGAGYDISVVLTGGLKDLAGNPLANPQSLRFRTEVKPGVPTVQVLQESFDNQFQMDQPNTTADWGVTTAGTLQGGAVTTTTVSVALSGTQYPGGVRTRVRDHPFAQQGSAGVGHEQWIFAQAWLGNEGAITQIGWGPSSNALFASDHSRVKVTLGHTQSDALSLNMSNNFDVGTPVKVTDAFYSIPQRATIDPPCNTDACAVGYWPFPAFNQFFEYNGKNNLIVDVDATLGTNYQITRIFFGPVGFPNTNTFASTGSSSGSLLQPVVPDTQFVKKRRTTTAISKFYDSGVNNPDYTTPIVVPAQQTGGTSMQLEFEGADGILFPVPGNPNNVIPDPTTFSGYRTNLDQLDGLRFLRFRITFVSNVNTGKVPEVQSLSIPYIF